MDRQSRGQWQPNRRQAQAIDSPARHGRPPDLGPIRIANLRERPVAPRNMERDLLLFVVLITFFFKFRPKTACQAQKPPKSLKLKEIELAI